MLITILDINNYLSISSIIYVRPQSLNAAGAVLFKRINEMELLLKVGIQIEHAADNPRYSQQNQENPPANGNIKYKAKCIERNQAN